MTGQRKNIMKKTGVSAPTGTPNKNITQAYERMKYRTYGNGKENEA